MNNSPGEQLSFAVARLHARRVVAVCQVIIGLAACSVIAPTLAQDATNSKSDSTTVVNQRSKADAKSTDSKKSDSSQVGSRSAARDKTRDAESKSNLISSEFPKGWKYFSAESGTRLSDVWRVQKNKDPQENILICKGMPEGYLRTDREFDDFEMGLEWMYPTDENGNSGVLLHMSPKDKIWPDSIQLQLHRPTAGSIFPSGEGKSENTLQLRDLSVGLNKWNRCRITSRGGKLTVEVNGKNVGEVRRCIPSRGRIALQSEGSEIHFRKIWIRRLKPELH